MKRGTDHLWTLVRYRGDIAIYATCNCGYSYLCSGNKRNEDGSWSFEQEVKWLSNYCPNCGARKKRVTENVECNSRYRFE